MRPHLDGAPESPFSVNSDHSRNSSFKFPEAISGAMFLASGRLTFSALHAPQSFMSPVAPPTCSVTLHPAVGFNLGVHLSCKSPEQQNGLGQRIEAAIEVVHAAIQPGMVSRSCTPAQNMQSSARGGDMKRLCRDILTPSWRRRQFDCPGLLRHIRIVTDPKMLACRNAEVEKIAREERTGSNKRNE